MGRVPFGAPLWAARELGIEDTGRCSPGLPGKVGVRDSAGLSPPGDAQGALSNVALSNRLWCPGQGRSPRRPWNARSVTPLRVRRPLPQPAGGALSPRRLLPAALPPDDTWFRVCCVSPKSAGLPAGGRKHEAGEAGACSAPTPWTSAGPSARSPRADAARPSCPLQDAAGTGWVFPRPRRTCLGGRSSQTRRSRSARPTRPHARRPGARPGQTPATGAQREGARAGAVPAAGRRLTSDNGAPPRPPAAGHHVPPRSEPTPAPHAWSHQRPHSRGCRRSTSKETVGVQPPAPCGDASDLGV